MSFNRENIAWQSKDGKWSLGFYECWPINDDDDDHDPEWDVEYGDQFEWVSTGHATEEAAQNSWNGANPGGGSVMEWSDSSAKACEQLDIKAQSFLANQMDQTKLNRNRGW